MFVKRFCINQLRKGQFNPTYSILKHSYLSGIRLCSKSYSGVEDSRSKSKAEKLLDDSSPLKRNHLDKNDWATTAYPEGTLFGSNWQDRASLRPRADPKSTSIVLFPGQGTQFVGMGREVAHIPVVQDMYAAASQVLGYDLLKLSLHGPLEQLNRTEHCQPAVLVASLAAVERLKEDHPEAINGCVATAGFSVGEVAALVFAGSLTFEKGVKLVKIRAAAMQACAEMVPSGMMTVILGADSTLGQACADAKQHCQGLGIQEPVCGVANYLAPAVKVIAGHKEALNFIAEHTDKYCIRRTKWLPVSGAFHTPLMEPAVAPLKKVLSKINIADPIVPVLSNVDGRRYITRDHVYSKLPKQMVAPVKWEQVLHALYSRPQGADYPFTYECGPGSSLKTILKKVNAKAHGSCRSIFV